MDELTIAAMAERLERLESRCRRVKRVGILLGLFGGLSLMVMGIAGAQLVQNEVEASRIL